MTSYPFAIQDYLYRLTIESRHPGYLYISPCQQILDAGGSLAYYGLQSYDKGQSIHNHVCFLHGLLPLEGEPIQIPLVQFNSEHVADLHLFPGELGDWVLLLDATAEAHDRQRTQQMAYDLKWKHNHYFSSCI